MYISKKDLKKVLAEAEEFPAIPQNIHRILMLSNSPDVSLKEIGDVIIQDVSLTTRFLRMVNSSYYGLGHEVTDIHVAVSLLGIHVIRDIAVTLSLMDVFPIRQAKEYELLFEESVTAAISADIITQIAGQSGDANVFLAGLLSNLGAFMFMRYLPEEYSLLIQEAKNRRLDVRVVEKLHLGVDQDEAGRLIAERWELPQIVRRCFDPEASQSDKPNSETDAQKTNQVCVYARLGKLAAEVFYKWNLAEKIARFKTELEDMLAMEENTAMEILSAVPKVVNESGFNHSIGFQPLPDFDWIRKKAQEELLVNHHQYETTYRELYTIKGKYEKAKKEKKSLENHLSHCQSLVKQLVHKIKHR